MYTAKGEDSAVRCENCNAENADNVEYCTNCGERITYGEDFFKRENNVEFLPRLSKNVKPIRAFRWRKPPLIFFRNLFKKTDVWVVPEGTENSKNTAGPQKNERIKQVVALLIVAMIFVSMLFTRVVM